MALHSPVFFATIAKCFQLLSPIGIENEHAPLFLLSKAEAFEHAQPRESQAFFLRGTDFTVRECPHIAPRFSRNGPVQARDAISCYFGSGFFKALKEGLRTKLQSKESFGTGPNTEADIA